MKLIVIGGSGFVGRNILNQMDEKRALDLSVKMLLYPYYNGYDDPSNYSKYHYHREGLLAKIPSVRYEKGLVMIREEDLDTVVSFIKKYNADLPLFLPSGILLPVVLL